MGFLGAPHHVVLSVYVHEGLGFFSLRVFTKSWWLSKYPGISGT